MSKVIDLSTEYSQTFFCSKSIEKKIKHSKKKVTFTPSIGVFYIESYKKYNKIDCKYKKENLKNFNKSKRVGCSCEIL